MSSTLFPDHPAAAAGPGAAPAPPPDPAAAADPTGDETVRTILARQMATLLPSLDLAHRQRLRERVEQMLRRLVRDESVRVRAAIADVVKDMPQAPRSLILRLARDAAVPVGGPVIRLSPLLTQDDLLALLATPALDHARCTIAARHGLPEAVADAIAATGDPTAIQALLANRSSAIREATLDALIRQASRHDAWHEPLVRRPILPTHSARALSLIVADGLLEELSTRGDLDPALRQDLQARLAGRVAAGTAPPQATTAAAMAEAYRLQDRHALTEDALIEAARRGEARLATAILAVAAGVPLAAVEQAIVLRSTKGLVSLVWKAGFSMQASRPIQTLLTRLPPETTLACPAGGGFPLSEDEMRWHIGFLTRPRS